MSHRFSVLCWLPNCQQVIVVIQQQNPVLNILRDSPIIVCVLTPTQKLDKLFVVRDDYELEISLAPSMFN